MHERRRDPRYCQIVLDANALDRVNKKRSSLVDEFNAFVEVHELSVIKPQGVEIELSHQHTPRQVRNDMDGIFTLKTNLTSDEIKRRDNLRRLMTGNAKSTKHFADADHLFEASKYGGGYFVTHEKRFFQRANDITKLAPGLCVITLADFVDLCRQLDG